MSKEEKKRKPSELLKYSIGTDISKDKFDVCISSIDFNQEVKIIATRCFKNTVKGIDEFYQWSNTKCKQDIPVVFVLEATGVYYEQLAYYLHDKDCKVSVVLPNRSKKYLLSIGVKSKNDKIDSKALSRMGAEQKLELWKAPSESIIQLRNLTRQKESLEKAKTSVNNQLKSLQCAKFVNVDIVEQQKEIIALIDEKISETEKLISKQIKDDKELYERYKKVSKVRGLSLLTIATVIAETNAFTLFNNQRQLVSYAGYDVVENQSGKHVGKTKISKRGNAHIRRIMYMAALTAVTHNEPIFKGLYERVYERTKIKMKGYVAVQRKLLVLIYTLWKNNSEYIPNHNSSSGNDESKLLFSQGF